MSNSFATDVSTSSQNIFNDSVAHKVCRICLANGLQMQNIVVDNLDKYYECITGLTLKPDDQLPKVLCWECAGRLKTANTLREKAIKSHVLLSNIARLDKGITMEDLNSIDREENKLKTSLVKSHYEFNFVEEVVKIEPVKLEYTEELNVEFEENIDIGSIKCDKDESQIDEISNNLQENFDNNIVSYQIKIDRDDNEDDNTVDDDNNEDRDDEEVKFKPDNIDKVDGSESSDEVESLQNIKLKIANTKDKKVQTRKIVLLKKSNFSEYKSKTNALQESDLSSCFTITPVTFEEQIAEIEKRKESAAYRKKRYKCTVCYAGFSSKWVYDAHLVKHSEKKGLLECFVCRKRFKKPSYLQRHIHTNHTELYSCKTCKFSTTSGATAKEHKKSHTGRMYDCSQCTEKFKIFTSYVTHLRIKHPSQFVCNLCGYTFVSAKGVERHKHFKHGDSTVETNGPFCEKCDVRFASEDAFQRHLKLSSLHKEQDGDNPQPIRNEPSRESRECKTERRRGRRKEVVRPPPVDSVTCEMCGLVLSGFRAYTGHFRASHPGHTRTQYCVPTLCMCELCGKRFRCKSLLIEHMNVHTLKEEYKCESCERTFHDKVKLRLHRQAHKNIKYPCPHCELQFSQATNRSRHVLTVHERLMEFHCDMCGKTVSTANSLKQHIAFVHDKVPRPKRVRHRVNRSAPPRAGKNASHSDDSDD